MTHLHLVPAVPPEINGLGDYARQLYRYWSDDEVHWHVAALSVPDGAEAAWPGPTFHKFEAKATSLVATVDKVRPDILIVHYVGYGYQLKGIPVWLSKALKLCKAKFDCKIVIFFHELYASGRPWSSAFWVKPVARKIVRDLLEVSDRWASSCERYMEMLAREAPNDDRGMRIPIGSNIETVLPVDWNRTWPLRVGGALEIAIFGSGPGRIATLRAHAQWLAQAAEQGCVARLVLIGSSMSPKHKAMEDEILKALPLKIIHHINQTEEQVSTLLSDCNLGLISYPWPILTKSGAHAAYIRHGMWTLAAGPLPDGVAPFSHENVLSERSELARLAERQALYAELGWENISLKWQTLLAS